MIRPYEHGDEKKLNCNEFSDFSKYDFVFGNILYEKYTLETLGVVRGIVIWHEYKPREFGIFFLMPNDIKIGDIKELKQFLNNATNAYSPKSCMTASLQDDRLERWHKFFGFEKIGQAVVDGKTVNTWGATWE
jgi:hypothetical protein